MSSYITIQTPAKVNFTLRILGKRSDGFHELDSLLVPVSLFDDLTVRPAQETTLEIDHDPSISIDHLGAMEDNLIVRALRLVEAEVGRVLPVAISLYKRIPLGGGLGGGSSNCAGMFHALNLLFDFKISVERLVALAAQLGSDIPAFIWGGYVHMQGRGERVTPLRFNGQLLPVQLILLNCGAHCPTGIIYKNTKIDLTRTPSLDYTMPLLLLLGEIDPLVGLLQNDLEAAAFRLFPEVAHSAQLLKEAGCRCVMLSGSGATVFGLTTDQEDAGNCLRRLKTCGCWYTSVCSLPDSVMAAHGPLTPIAMVRIHVGQPR